MKYREEWPKIVDSIRQQTVEIKKELGMANIPMLVQPEMEDFVAHLTKALKWGLENGHLVEHMPERSEMKECVGLMETKCDHLLFVKWWIARLLLVKGSHRLGSHFLNGLAAEGVPKAFLRNTWQDGKWGITLIIEEVKEVEELQEGKWTWDFSVEDSVPVCTDGKMVTVTKRVETELLKFDPSKPTRIVGKIFGEKIATKLASLMPMKRAEVELHFTRKYIPECYRELTKDENLTSCMSKESAYYGLDSSYHPVMAYEGSSNALLCLIWSTVKERYIARAIGYINNDRVSFSTSYGASGTYDQFIAFDLEQDSDTYGMELKLIEHKGILAPYVDGDSQCFDVDYERGVLVVGGDREMSYETGRLLSENREECSCCGGWVDEDDVMRDHEEDVYGPCCEERFVYCDDIGGRVFEDYATWCEDISEYRYEEYFYCDHSGEYYSYSMESVEVEYRSGLGRECRETIAKCNLNDWIEDNLENIISIDGEPYESETEDAA